MKLLGVIPSRKGSKGLPGKNTKLLAGKPLIEYTINASLLANELSGLVISSDDESVLSMGTRRKVQTIKRPSSLSGDSVPMIDVLLHSLSEVEESYDAVMVLQPTSPLRSSSDIDSAINLFINSGANSLVSVYKVDDHHPARMYKIVDETLSPLDGNLTSVNRQDLPDIYHRNGAIYISKIDSMIKSHSILCNHPTPYIMPLEKSVNIDNYLDFRVAEILIKDAISRT